VRINQLPLGLADLEAIVPAAPDLILLPKVERAAEVEQVDRKIGEIQAALRIDRPLYLMPILETALGVENAFPVASASPRVVALTLGLEDLTADLGVVKTRLGAESLYARSRVVNAARAASIQAIDSVYGDVDDLEGLASWCAGSRGLGFSGLGCVHPRQIPAIHAAFAPSTAEIERASRIVHAFAEAEAAGLSVVSLGSKMIDPPVVARAAQLIERAQAMGLLNAANDPDVPQPPATAETEGPR
jgi:citrate lyase subunit beta/citryl-CoA lyase